MKRTLLPALLAILVVSTFIVLAHAQYPPEIVIIKPPVITIVNDQITGVIAFKYPDGTPVVLKSPYMTIRVCSKDKCVTIPNVAINADGTFSIPISSLQGLTGTLTLWIVAGSLTDSHGNTFPAVDTEIGTVTVAGSSQNGTVSQAQKQEPPKPASQVQYRIAQNPTPDVAQTASQSNTAITFVPIVLSLLAAFGAAMLFLLRKK